MYHLYTDMPLIEGVGDEVTVFFAVVFLFLILCIAWVSTNIQELPFFSVIVIEFTRRHTRIGQQNPTESASSSSSNSSDASSSDNGERNTSPSLVEEILNDLETPLGNDSSNDESVEHENVPKTSESPKNEGNNELASTSTNSESTSTENVAESVEEDLPASETELRQRRVAFFAKSGCSTESKNTSEIKQDNNEQENSSSSLGQTDSESRNAGSRSSNERNETTGEQTSQAEKVTIRLKYLNDTQRNVEASLDDTIDQFRRTHFADELAANKLVRFIFNGQDLRNGSNTLQAYNVVDNSVIHCLITQANRQTTPPATDAEEDGFDIGMLMFPCFGLILIFMWYLRFEYRQFFSGTSTVCLIGISLLYIAGILALMENRRRGHHHAHVE